MPDPSRSAGALPHQRQVLGAIAERKAAGCRPPTTIGASALTGGRKPEPRALRTGRGRLRRRCRLCRKTFVCDTRLIGDARVSKTDGSQSLDLLQRDTLEAAGGDAVNVYHDLARGCTGPTSRVPTAACAPLRGRLECRERAPVVLTARQGRARRRVRCSVPRRTSAGDEQATSWWPSWRPSSSVRPSRRSCALRLPSSPRPSSPGASSVA